MDGLNVGYIRYQIRQSDEPGIINKELNSFKDDGSNLNL
mgnify:CR=1 FL=1